MADVFRTPRWSHLRAALLFLAAAPHTVNGDSAPAVANDDGITAPKDVVEFVDEDGDSSNLTVERPGALRWCASRHSFGCRSLRQLSLDLRGPCRYQVTYVPPGTGVMESYAIIAQPPPGPVQRQLALRLLRLAHSAGVSTIGSASIDLALDGGDSAPDLFVHQPPLEFPVPFTLPTHQQGSQISHMPFYLRLPGNWSNANITGLAIVRRPEDCNVCTFSAGQGHAARRLLHQVRPEAFLDVEVPRPSFALPLQETNEASSHNHSVCLCGQGLVNAFHPLASRSATSLSLAILGLVAYYIPPRVGFLEDVFRMGVRTFLNPGWHGDVRLLCENCSSSNRVALHALKVDSKCRGLVQESLAAAAAASKDGQIPENVDFKGFSDSGVREVARGHSSDGTLLACLPPQHGPCTGHVEEAFSFGRPQVDPAGGKEVTFTLEGKRRLMSKERQALLHHRSALCFYPVEGDPSGWLVGFSAMHMDGPDMQAFIGFVCFFGVALPLICLVTALLHYNKYERCKQHVNQVRLDFQRSQLERELNFRRDRSRQRASAEANHGGITSVGAGGVGVTELPNMYWPLAGSAAHVS